MTLLVGTYELYDILNFKETEWKYQENKSRLMERKSFMEG